MEKRGKLYALLVNRIPGIRERYHKVRDRGSGSARIRAWIYLLWLNFRWYVLRNKSLRTPTFADPDRRKKLCRTGSESASAKQMPPEELAAQLAAYDIISFDVFDTLLFRPFDRPYALFYPAGEALGYPDFAHIRRQFEQKARQQKRAEHGNGEVTYAEIWELLEAETGMDAAAGSKIEWEAEKRYCFANPYFLEVVRELQEKYHKPWIFVSDMYFDSVQITELLTVAGYPLPQAGFVSCEYGVSKGDGGLYRLVREHFGEDKTYIHVGDNAFSDQKKAKEAGWAVSPYPNVNQAGTAYRCADMSVITGSLYRGLVNAHLQNGLCACSKTYEFGYVYGGLFVTGYCQFIHSYVKAHGIEKLLFLSRDGDILRQAYVRLYPEEAQDCAYVFWSRSAGTKMTAAYYKYDYFRRFVYHKVNQSYRLEQIFASMELSDLLEGFLQDAETKYRKNGRAAYTADSLLDWAAADAVRVYLTEHWAEVPPHYEEQIAAGGRYYTEVLNGCSSAAAIDIGWAGSGAVTLDCLVHQVWHLDCAITGLVAGTNSAFTEDTDSSEARLHSGRMVSYLFSQTHNRDVWKTHNPDKGHNVIMELLLASEQGSFVRFSDAGPVFAKPADEIDAAEVQRGILDFVDQFTEHFGRDEIIPGRDAMAPILMLYNDPHWLDDVIRKERVRINLDE